MTRTAKSMEIYTHIDFRGEATFYNVAAMLDYFAAAVGKRMLPSDLEGGMMAVTGVALNKILEEVYIDPNYLSQPVKPWPIFCVRDSEITIAADSAVIIIDGHHRFVKWALSGARQVPIIIFKDPAKFCVQPDPALRQWLIDNTHATAGNLAR